MYLLLQDWETCSEKIEFSSPSGCQGVDLSRKPAALVSTLRLEAPPFIIAAQAVTSSRVNITIASPNPPPGRQQSNLGALNVRMRAISSLHETRNSLGFPAFPWICCS